jgi:hypothetical protein
MTLFIMVLVLLCCVSFMLSVAYKRFMLSVIMLNVVLLSVVMLNVVAPWEDLRGIVSLLCEFGLIRKVHLVNLALKSELAFYLSFSGLLPNQRLIGSNVRIHLLEKGSCPE